MMGVSRGAAKSKMDRRRFLQSAALVTAGTAFGGSLVACGDEVVLEIPCLGPAAAPTPVPGMTYIRASTIGCALDCSLEDGRNKYSGGAATDDAPRINAAMTGATVNNPITLIIDGSALISGLFLPAGGYWSIAGLGCGTGFFIKTGTNNDGIHNGSPDAALPSDPGPPAPPRGSAVSLSNFTVSGNQGNGHNGDSTSGATQGLTNGSTWYFGINLMNLNDITVQNVVIVNVPSYHIRFSNVGNVSVSGCVLQSGGFSTDGLHFDGPANDIVIANCAIACGDDSIALNCPEGYSGNISRVSVTGCTFNSLSVMRLYTTHGVGAPAFTIDSVSVSNCSGTLSAAAFLIGTAGSSLPNSVASLTLSDCTFTASVVLGIAENFGTIELNNVTFIPTQSHVIWVQPQSNLVCGFLRPSPLYGGVTYAGSSLSFNNCVISRTSKVDVAAVMLESRSTIASVSFNGFGMQDAGSYAPVPELLNIDSGSVAQLSLGSVRSSSIASPVAAGQFSNVGSVTGTNLLATGWAFPDAVMANGVPYLSADSGLASIKVTGTAQPYP